MRLQLFNSAVIANSKLDYSRWLLELSPKQSHKCSHAYFGSQAVTLFRSELLPAAIREMSPRSSPPQESGRNRAYTNVYKIISEFGICEWLNLVQYRPDKFLT